MEIFSETTSLIEEIKFASGAGEWCKYRINICKGCDNNCKYCYARADAARRKQISPDLWVNGEVKLKLVTKGYRKRDGRIMFPSTHDITPDNVKDCLTVLGKLLKSKNELLIVTKPHLECVKLICDEFLEYKNQKLFRFTIGSLYNEVLNYWEPNAPLFEERLESLKYAHENGYQTSISAEPFLDNQVEELVETLRPYVTNSIWIGEANDLKLRMKFNGELNDESEIAADNLLALYGSNYKFHLYERYNNDPLIKWKDSLKMAFNLERPTESGLDI